MEKNLPQHIAIIMDGNRRWAKQKGLKPSEGHKEGIEALEKIVRYANKKGIKFLTVYALSSENLENREKDEIKSLFNLIKEGFIKKFSVLKKEGVKIKFLGEINKLPLTTRKILEVMEKNLENGQGLTLSIALNYSARREIFQAAKKMNESSKEEDFSKALTTKELPEPDLIIRTGGKKRLSNFLLWQASYSELFFTNKLWPDFDEKEFEKALRDFAKRKRNFGS